MYLFIFIFRVYFRHNNDMIASDYPSTSEATLTNVDEIDSSLGPFLLTWFNFYPSMDK